MKICITCKKIVADFELFSTGECEKCYCSHEDLKPLSEIEKPNFTTTL